MAENADLCRGRFLWHIYNPFLRERNSKATFYLGSPSVTQWKVTIQPIARLCVSYWKFSFSLEFDRGFDSRDQIVADRLLILIRLNGKLNTKKVMNNYIFNGDNEFACNFVRFATVHPQMEPHFLVIRIEIFLPGRSIQNDIGNGIFSGEKDLEFLSDDLDVLLYNEKFYNMSLTSDPEPIKAHSYIINARWDNFFQLHEFAVGTQDTVQTNISHAVLCGILTYMYSGAVRCWPDWEEAEYSAELFQVIDRYKLYHLYKVFAKTDLLQLRVTRNHVLITSRLFPLDIINNHLINNAPHTWYVNLSTEYEFIFRIQLQNDNRDGPFISYSLKSRSPSKVYVEVNLEIMKRGKDNELQRLWHFHARNFNIDPYETARCRSVGFYGYPEILEDFHGVSSDGTDIKYFIHCFLNVINGNTVMQVQSEHSDTLQNDETRFGILSNHLHKLSREQIDTDMTIIGVLAIPNIYSYTHKGILATRLPGIGENYYPEVIPNIAETRLSQTTLPIVLNYMYTGKLFNIPFEKLDEMEDFAEDNEFYSLQQLIDRIRSFYIDY